MKLADVRRAIKPIDATVPDLNDRKVVLPIGSYYEVLECRQRVAIGVRLRGGKYITLHTSYTAVQRFSVAA